jgi:fumarate hydratase subunit alpha
MARTKRRAKASARGPARAAKPGRRAAAEPRTSKSARKPKRRPARPAVRPKREVRVVRTARPAKPSAGSTGRADVREIAARKIADTVARLSMEANVDLEGDVLKALRRGLDREESPVGKEIFNQLLENADIARTEKLPICQDTGLAVVFVDLGQDAHVSGGGLDDAINEGVRRGYTEGYLRKSVLGDPLKRVNTKDNTPAVIHTRIVPGDKLRLWVVPKGGGSENMSKIAMLKPADGVEGVKKFVVESVRVASANPCPPIIVGVGIGGSFEQCAMNAKRALLREVGSTHADSFYAGLERELLEKVNNLGVGPMGLGGRVTALAVHIVAAPCHIASLPVAVNINCHAARHKMAEL